MKKKIVTLLLAAALTVSLAGCGSTSADEPTEASQTQEETATDNTDTEEAAAKEAEANEYYEAGRASLYGLDGVEMNVETAYNNFKKAAELGKVDANFYLGVLCDVYAYPQKDYEMAKNYYEQCENNSYAQIQLGFLYLTGNGVEEDKEKAKEIFQTIIEQGCVEGYYGNSDAAYDEADYDTAFEYANKVLEEGTEPLYIAGAMYTIGELYYYGYGVEQDYAKALEWYEKAADLGNSEGMNEIGFLHYSGYGVEQDYAKALEWFEKAADLGNATGMNNIGFLYYYGYGVEQDYIKALEWFEKAADLGEPNAMHVIGKLYANGYGVEQDYAKALEWYEKAADLGHSTGMSDIGYLYANGYGVEQDYAKAFEWYEKAANLGNSFGMNNIGYLYANGYGVEQDYEKALEWFEKAAALGHELAKESAEAIRQQLQ